MVGRKKYQLKERLKHFHFLKTWQLILILIPLFFIVATLLRFDHLKMVSLRNAVLTADREEDDAKIAESLQKLKDFTFSHIVINVVEDNGQQRITFGTGPFYLEHQYLRAATAAFKAAEEKFARAPESRGNIYGEASSICRTRALHNGWTWDNPNYINCMVTEIGKYPAGANLEDQIKAILPSTELYRKNYASPLWAPSLSGFVILLVILLIVVIFIRLLIWLILRLSLLFF